MDAVILPEIAQEAWRLGQIVQILQRTSTISSFFIDVGPGFYHVAGQHLVVRLTSPDGYSATRSYSIASAPSNSGIVELAIERLDDGEVSPYFHEVAAERDTVEWKGPLGGHFVWRPDDQGAILLIGGGSGLVPLMSIARQHRDAAVRVPMGLLLSARTRADALYFNELDELDRSSTYFSFNASFTREPPARNGDFGRRVDERMVSAVLERLGQHPAQTFICGANSFVNAAADSVLAAGISPQTVRTERYGG